MQAQDEILYTNWANESGDYSLCDELGNCIAGHSYDFRPEQVTLADGTERTMQIAERDISNFVLSNITEEIRAGERPAWDIFAWTRTREFTGEPDFIPNLVREQQQENSR